MGNRDSLFLPSLFGDKLNQNNVLNNLSNSGTPALFPINNNDKFSSLHLGALQSQEQQHQQQQQQIPHLSSTSSSSTNQTLHSQQLFLPQTHTNPLFSSFSHFLSPSTTAQVSPLQNLSHQVLNLEQENKKLKEEKVILWQQIEHLKLLTLQKTEKKMLDEELITPAFLSKLSSDQLKKLQALLIEEQEHRRLCVVCLDRHARVVFLPCHHQKVCEQCGDAVVVCPYCQTRITNRIKPFWIQNNNNRTIN